MKEKEEAKEKVEVIDKLMGLFCCTVRFALLTILQTLDIAFSIYNLH